MQEFPRPVYARQDDAGLNKPISSESVQPATETLSKNGMVSLPMPSELMNAPKDNDDWFKPEEFRLLLDFGLQNKDENIKRSAVYMCSRLSSLKMLLDDPEQYRTAYELIFQVHEMGKLYTELLTAKYQQDNNIKLVPGSKEYEPYAQSRHINVTGLAGRLNALGKGRYSIFVPIEKSTFNGIEMTGGTSASLVKEVQSWGVKGESGMVQRKAFVR